MWRAALRDRASFELSLEMGLPSPTPVSALPECRFWRAARTARSTAARSRRSTPRSRRKRSPLAYPASTCGVRRVDPPLGFFWNVVSTRLKKTTRSSPKIQRYLKILKRYLKILDARLSEKSNALDTDDARPSRTLGPSSGISQKDRTRRICGRTQSWGLRSRVSIPLGKKINGIRKKKNATEFENGRRRTSTPSTGPNMRPQVWNPKETPLRFSKLATRTSPCGS